MDQIKIGKFISKSRKDKKLTQEQLAEKLGISKNAVSKWERGLNLPDVSIMQELCVLLNISLNELFAGEHLSENVIVEQSEKNIIDVLKVFKDKNNRYKFLIAISVVIIAILLVFLGRNILVRNGYLIDNNLKYSQKYAPEKEIIKGNVDIDYFVNINIDFEIGANKFGNAVFKNPQKALKRLKRDYRDGIKAIQKEFGLLPLSIFNYKEYGTYGWQLVSATDEEKEQGRFITRFMDIYENSFNK